MSGTRQELLYVPYMFLCVRACLYVVVHVHMYAFQLCVCVLLHARTRPLVHPYMHRVVNMTPPTNCV